MQPDCIDHGRQSKVGYASSGSARKLGKQGLLHRRVFQEINGYLPPVVMHTCDNRRCINPAHLVAGDWATNNKDRAAKNRSARSVVTRRKISMGQAVAIRTRWRKRKPKQDLVNGVMAIANDYGVDSGVIYNIVRGKTHVYF